MDPYLPPTNNIDHYLNSFSSLERRGRKKKSQRMGTDEMVMLILMVSSVARMMSHTIGYPGYLSTLVNKSWEDGSVVRVLAPKV